MILLALAATRAAAQDGDFDDAGAAERLRDFDDNVTDDLGDEGSTGANGDSTLSRSRLALGFAGSASPRSSGSTGNDAGVVIEGAPPLSAVVIATLRAGGLTDDPVPGWRTRSRWSALIPAVSSRVGNSESWREVTDPTVSRALSYDVRVSWRLDRLIYDPNEPRFAAFDISRRRERRRLIALATHAYVEWLHARAAELATAGEEEAPLALTSPERRAARTLIEVRLAEAELDALTDGWFSHVLNKPTRSR